MRVYTCVFFLYANNACVIKSIMRKSLSLLLTMFHKKGTLFLKWVSETISVGTRFDCVYWGTLKLYLK